MYSSGGPPPYNISRIFSPNRPTANQSWSFWHTPKRSSSFPSLQHSHSKVAPEYSSKVNITLTLTLISWELHEKINKTGFAFPLLCDPQSRSKSSKTWETAMTPTSMASMVKSVEFASDVQWWKFLSHKMDQSAWRLAVHTSKYPSLHRSIRYSYESKLK